MAEGEAPQPAPQPDQQQPDDTTHDSLVEIDDDVSAARRSRRFERSALAIVEWARRRPSRS